MTTSQVNSKTNTQALQNHSSIFTPQLEEWMKTQQPQFEDDLDGSDDSDQSSTTIDQSYASHKTKKHHASTDLKGKEVAHKNRKEYASQVAGQIFQMNENKIHALFSSVTSMISLSSGSSQSKAANSDINAENEFGSQSQIGQTGSNRGATLRQTLAGIRNSRNNQESTTSHSTNLTHPTSTNLTS